MFFACAQSLTKMEKMPIRKNDPVGKNPSRNGAMTIIIDTLADDHNSWHGKTCSQSFSELPRKKRTGQASDLFNQITFK